MIFLAAGVGLLAILLVLGRQALPDLLQERGDLQGINALRGLAAMGVLVYHVTFALPQRGLTMAIFGQGWRGVALFFFLSGFLLQRPFAAALKSGRPVDISRYLLRRFLRIVPLYVFVTLVVYAVTRGTLQVLLSSLTFTANYFGLDHVVGVAWTLDDEVSYYVLLPALFLAVSLVTKRWRSLVLVLAVCGLMFASSRAADGQGPLPQFVPFGVGMLAATAITWRPVRRGAPRFLSWAPLVMIGEVSYGIYLWHQPVLHVIFNAGVLSDQFWLASVQLAVWTVAISTATYIVIERPANGLARRRLPARWLARVPLGQRERAEVSSQA
jgi:peptidoglycan/LPS O-acetylase OafA/YrhL